MSGALVAVIILVAILGGYLIDYQKNKLQWESKNSKQDEEVDDLRKLVQQMKKRIENLEAIAAQNPDDFKMNDANPRDFIEVDDKQSITEENKQKVADRAKTKRE
ncbi:MAG: hypothetical protein U5K72_01470 [Balneolaceae bacterium]|nr:hypothetical protein [Balneolaceae bacterium]